MRLTQQTTGAHSVYRPRFACGHGDTVQAEGGRDNRDLDSLPSREDRRTLGFGLGASCTGVLDLRTIKIIEGPLQAGKALIDSMIGGCRADVIARRGDRSHDLRWSREHRIVPIGPARPSERYLLVTDREVRRGDHRLHASQQWCEVIAALTVPARVLLRAVPQGVVPQQIPVHHNGDVGPPWLCSCLAWLR